MTRRRNLLVVGLLLVAAGVTASYLVRGLCPLPSAFGMSRNGRLLRLNHESANPGARIERSNDMKYMLMMHAPRGTGDWGVVSWTPEALKGHIEFMHRLNKDLTEAGELVDAQGLAAPGEARVVRAGKGGLPEVTDGPFAEAKEFLAGFWIVDCETREQAYAIAARASSAPGPKGTPLNMAIEVREVMGAPPVDR